MWDILFGWRKASKCKKLIRRVQCRLKLLKNKRCCIVKQLRDDVAQLLKHGHDQTAFERVEQIFKDETLVEVYDLLFHFCEFVIINLPYIRKHKNCPSDISEAISTLIFSSARFGGLPELLTIRKLFGERYGQRFVTAALELLPENLVNNQIKESLYIKNVPDDVKYRLLDEIASSCNEAGPLLLEYKPVWQEEQATKTWSNRFSSEDVPMENQNGGLQLQISNSTEAELGKIVHVDLSSEIKKVNKDHPMKPAEEKEMDKLEDSSSENSDQLPEEMIYLDDIQEFTSKDENLKDQRLFMFKSFRNPLKKEQTDYGNSLEESNEISGNESRSSTKTRKSSRKSSRKRSISRESRVTDIECAIYYGESDEMFSSANKHKSRQRRNKSSVDVREKTDDLEVKCGRDSKIGGIFDKCSLEDPCYNFSCRECENVLSHCWIPKMKSSKIVHSLVEEKIQYGLEFCKDSQRGVEEEEEKHCNLRAMSMMMISERGNEGYDDNENITRSKSFPLDEGRNRHSSCRHIHPKLPDYDELAEKFMALKRENMQNKRQSE